MQTSSLKIWTRFTNSISYNDNRYATHTHTHTNKQINKQTYMYMSLQHTEYVLQLTQD